MTFLGYIFVPLGVGFWVFRPRWLLPLAIFAAVFQAGSVLNIRDVGLQPYYFVSILIVLRLFHAWLFNSQFKIRIPPSSLIFPLLAFWGWATVSAVIMPVIFNGLPVLVPSVDIESFYFPVTPLHFSTANLAQVMWLTLNVGVVIFAASVGRWEQVRRAFILAVALATIVTLLQFALALRGHQFPEWIFQSNPGQHQAILGEYDRPNGLFSEPSFAGVLFTALTSGALAKFFGGGSVWMFVVSMICTLLVRSAASLAALAVCCVFLSIVYFPVRSLNHPNLSAARKRYAILAILTLAGIAIAATVPSIGEALATNTVDKAETASFISRTTADLAGLSTLVDSYGLGVGIGSIRTSSFLVTLLATTGVGALLLVWFLFLLLKKTQNSALRWMFLGALLTEVAGVPDLSLPLLWMNVCLLTVFALQASPTKFQERISVPTTKYNDCQNQAEHPSAE
jgi:hypothetical protein